MSGLVCVYVYYIFYFLLCFLMERSPCLYIQLLVVSVKEGKNDGINGKTTYITHNTHTGV